MTRSPRPSSKISKANSPTALSMSASPSRNMIGVGSGLANSGMIPYLCGASCFLTARAMEQVKVDLAYSKANVRICGMSSGMAYGTAWPNASLHRRCRLDAHPSEHDRRCPRRQHRNSRCHALLPPSSGTDVFCASAESPYRKCMQMTMNFNSAKRHFSGTAATLPSLRTEFSSRALSTLLALSNKEVSPLAC